MARTKSKTAKKAVRKTASKTAPKKRTTKRNSKKAPEKTTEKKVRGVGYVDGEMPFPMKIRGNLHLRFKAAAAELGELIAKAETAQAKIDVLLSMPKHIEVAKAIYEHKNAVVDARNKRTEFAQIQLEVGKKLGIPPEELQNYSFDAATGVVLPISPPD